MENKIRDKFNELVKEELGVTFDELLEIKDGKEFSKKAKELADKIAGKKKFLFEIKEESDGISLTFQGSLNNLLVNVGLCLTSIFQDKIKKGLDKDYAIDMLDSVFKVIKDELNK